MPSLELTRTVKIAFPRVIVPSAPSFGQNNEPNFNCTLLFPKDHPDLGRISQMMRDIAAQRFGADVNAYPKPWAWALKDGDTEDAASRAAGRKGKPWAKGFWILPLKASQKSPPRLGAVVNGQPLKFAISGDARFDARQYFYGGAMVIADINFGCFPKKGMPPGPIGAGVSAYMNALLSFGGERQTDIDLGSEREATDMYDPSRQQHVGHTTAATPMDGMAGGLPI